MSSGNKINIVVLSIYQDLGESFVEMLTPEQMESLPLGDMRASIEVIAGAPSQDKSFRDRITKADAVVVVVRFLDVLSLEKIKSIYRDLPTESNLPVGIILLRDSGEIDFKISCPACGQKLWLRDTDVGKRGRCPNCKKPFVIMSQADHIKAQLMLADGMLITRVVRGDLPSLEKALSALMKSVSGEIRPVVADAHSEALKNVTARIEIPEN